MAGSQSRDVTGASLLDDELAGWLRLTGTPGVGPAGCRALLAAFGLPDAIFGVPAARLREVVPAHVAAALARTPPHLQDLTARTRAWCDEPGNHVVTLADTRYPPLLLETTDPPPLLYVKGDVGALTRPAVAIVGSRNATVQGALDARGFAASLASAGHVVVSGLALGIDAAAHEGALGAGTTVAVIGTGADIVYPSSHRPLAHRIAEHGAIVSELPLGTTASAHQFPRRNRIIAGLSRGVLVIEAAARSGSLITARLASECGREVFAVPGSIHSPLSKGCHQLIRQGAKLVESVSDILEELGAPSPPVVGATGAPGAPETDPLLALIGFDPVLPDELAARAGCTPARLSALLLDLELAGRVARLPGGRVQRLVPWSSDTAPSRRTTPPT